MPSLLITLFASFSTLLGLCVFLHIPQPSFSGCLLGDPVAVFGLFSFLLTWHVCSLFLIFLVSVPLACFFFLFFFRFVVLIKTFFLDGSFFSSFPLFLRLRARLVFALVIF